MESYCTARPRVYALVLLPWCFRVWPPGYSITSSKMDATNDTSSQSNATPQNSLKPSTYFQEVPLSTQPPPPRYPTRPQWQKARKKVYPVVQPYPCFQATCTPPHACFFLFPSQSVGYHAVPHRFNPPILPLLVFLDSDLLAVVLSIPHVLWGLDGRDIFQPN